MSRYVDVYLLPVPTRNLAKYRKMARAAGKIFRKNGVLTYREYIGADLKPFPGMGDFAKTTKTKRNETFLYAAVEFKNESHRNRTMKKIFADPAMAKMAKQKPIFDMKRMLYGGFKLFVEV